MSPHGKTVLRDLGVVIHIPGLMAMVSLPLCWLFDESFAVGPLLATSAAALVPGQFLYWTFRQARVMQLRHAMVTVVVAWTLIPLIGMLPFLLTGLLQTGAAANFEGAAVFANFWNALFESVSGFTSTGLTMSKMPSGLPHTLQWWRSLMQWIGGVGIIVLMLSVFHPSTDAQRLYFAEAHELDNPSQAGQVIEAAYRIWWIYPLYTVFSIVLLRTTGMGWWHAANYGMTGIATGGFGVTDNSLADFGAGPRLAMILIMLAGAVSFATHYRLLTTGRFGFIWRDPEHHALLVLLTLGALLIASENQWYGASASWIDDLFQWTSALTTAGFSTVRLEKWSPTAHILLGLAMICGGAAGATTGGLKLKRIVTLVASVSARVRGVALHPWRLMEHKPISEPGVDEHRSRIVEAAAIMAVLWLVAILVGTLLMLHAVNPSVALHRVVLEVTSALGNVGLSSGVATLELHWSGKLGLIVLMWAGRLEIVPVVVIIAALIVRPRNSTKRESPKVGTK